MTKPIKYDRIECTVHASMTNSARNVIRHAGSSAVQLSADMITAVITYFLGKILRSLSILSSILLDIVRSSTSHYLTGLHGLMQG
jgi:hypothetical protein